ncbi:iron-sulfur cluster carrier protein ApbC [Vogesella facilis]|uniref:Iron-sulfur cluster carrier protein n=1 Tax=Vogesella facilis TaxID=1655232 RepID=A0ABV7RK16_9NEIS
MFSRLGKLFGAGADDSARNSTMTSTPTHGDDDILAALGTLIDPDTGKPYRHAKGVSIAANDAQQLVLNVSLPYPAQSRFAAIRDEFLAALAPFAAGRQPQVNVSSQITSHSVQRGLSPLPGVKNIIAVSSGKGGVGKSTTAANLALALAAEGARVGILDADIYGPSQPLMMGLQGHKPEVNDGKLQPLLAYGVQTMSIGFLVDEDQAMVWRGPMVSQALQQLLNDTLWHELDYLVIDMPPGTGDVQLTLSQKVPVTGAIIVTTPQDIALLDAKKGLKMFEKVGVPVLGIVENMAMHVCSNCGHEEHIFGHGGAERMAEQYGVPVLGSLPLDLSIRLATDEGKPTVIAEPDGKLAARYQDIARKLAVKVGEKARDFSSKIPKIVIQNN